jgi:hypothetical protein
MLIHGGMTFTVENQNRLMRGPPWPSRWDVRPRSTVRLVQSRTKSYAAEFSGFDASRPGDAVLGALNPVLDDVRSSLERYWVDLVGRDVVFLGILYRPCFRSLHKVDEAFGNVDHTPAFL